MWKKITLRSVAQSPQKPYQQIKSIAFSRKSIKRQKKEIEQELVVKAGNIQLQDKQQILKEDYKNKEEQIIQDNQKKKQNENDVKGQQKKIQQIEIKKIRQVRELSITKQYMLDIKQQKEQKRCSQCLKFKQSLYKLKNNYQQFINNNKFLFESIKQTTLKQIQTIQKYLFKATSQYWRIMENQIIHNYQINYHKTPINSIKFTTYQSKLQVQPSSPLKYSNSLNNLQTNNLKIDTQMYNVSDRVKLILQKYKRNL